MLGRVRRISDAANRTAVSAVTAPANAGSIAFHMSTGFTVTGPFAGYDGTDKDMVVFRRELPAVGRP